MITLVVFDMAGTTVTDDGLVATMGQSKIEVFTQILGDRDRAKEVLSEFEAAVGARGIRHRRGRGVVRLVTRERDPRMPNDRIQRQN